MTRVTAAGRRLDGPSSGISQPCSELLVEMQTIARPRAGRLVPPYLKGMCGFSHL